MGVAMARAPAVILVVAILGLGTCALLPESDTRERMAAALAPKRAECQRRIADWTRQGILTADRATASLASVRIDRDWWMSRQPDDRTEAALIMYCAWMPADGRYSVVIRDLEGSKLGSLVEGSWWPGW